MEGVVKEDEVEEEGEVEEEEAFKTPHQDERLTDLHILFLPDTPCPSSPS